MSTPATTDAAVGRLRAWLEVPLSYMPEALAEGETVLHLGTASGLPQVWEVGASGGEARRPLTTEERVGDLRAAPVGRRALVAVDRGGNEHWQLGVLDLAGRAPSLRFLTDAPDVIHFPGPWRKDGRSLLYASNARDRRFFDIYEQAIDGESPPRSLYEGDATHAARDLLGARVLVERANTNLDHDLLILEEGAARPVTAHEGELTILAACLLDDGVYAAANPGRELAALVRYRPGTNTAEFVQTFAGDLELVEPSPDRRQLALAVNRDGWSEVHLFDPATREDRLFNSGPKGVVSRISWYPDGSAFAYDLSSVEGVEVYRRTIATGKERRLTGSPTARPSPVPPPRLAKLRASDGVAIPYWEYAPANGGTRGTVLHVHGGPEAQARPSFSPFLSFLVAEGFRVIAPNVRGSSGYGRTFTHLDDVRRRMDSVRDLAEVARDLVRSGKGAPGRLGLIGGSYGGFMVLAAAAHYPELWGAAVDLVGIANLVTFLERTGAWRRPLREAEYGSLEKDRDFLEEISPIHVADRIAAPLLVIHGRNDPRVPVGEAEQIAATLTRLGRPVELLIFDNEGHGIVRRENQLRAWTRAAEFLAAHLGEGSRGPPGPAAPRAG